MQALHERYVASLIGKRAALADAWAAYRAHDPAHGVERDGALRLLASLAHRLAGSAGSYGFDELGRQAQVVDQLATRAQSQGGATLQAQLAAAVATLLTALDTQPRRR